MRQRMRAWISPSSIWLVGFLLVYCAIALALWPHRYISMLDLYLQQLKLVPVLLIFICAIGAVVMRPRAPIGFMREQLLPRAPVLLTVLALFTVGMSGFTTFKLAIPEVVPFYADPYLAAFERMLAGGHDPGYLLHQIVPPWASYPIGYLYGPVWLSLWMGTLGFVALFCTPQTRRRYFWSMALCLAGIGTVMAMALSSVGPVFYSRFFGGTEFDALSKAVAGSAVGDYMRSVSDYLMTAYATGHETIGTGISAMPSVHVAIVTLNAHLVSHLSRRVGILAWTYAGVIFFGSVYMSWHYVLDGVVSIAVVTAIWRAWDWVPALKERLAAQAAASMDTKAP